VKNILERDTLLQTVSDSDLFTGLPHRRRLQRT